MSNLTTSYKYDEKESEYVFSCRGRPFTSLVSSTLPESTSTLIDYELVRDLKIKMSDLQCKRFNFAGFKMRILGQISTAVQCINDGFVSGNFHFKAMVVLDLAKNLDTFSVAGKKLASQLSPSFDSSFNNPPSPKTQARTSAQSSPARTSSPTKGKTSPPSPRRATSSAQAAGTPSPITISPSPSNKSPQVSGPPTPSPPSTISCVSVRPLSSPPGFPTPRFVNQHTSAPPVCLSVRSCNLLRSPLSTNLEYFDETFGGADKMTSTDEKQALRNHFKDAEFEDLKNGGFIMKTSLGLRYWSGHGEYKFSPNCYKLYGNGANGVPNNCGFHQQWFFPEGFQPCGSSCKGAFCTCL